MPQGSVVGGPNCHLGISPRSDHGARCCFGRESILVLPCGKKSLTSDASQVSLVNGRIAFQGTAAEFFESDGYKAIAGGDDKDDEPAAVQDHKKPVAQRKVSNLSPATIAALKPKSFAQVAAQRNNSTMSTASSTEVTSASEGGDDDSDSDPTIDGDELKLHGKLLATPPEAEKKPRKLVEEEGRAVGRVSGAVWKLYLGMMGGIFFWFFFVVIFAGAKLSDVAQTWWLGVWAGACEFSYRFRRRRRKS